MKPDSGRVADKRYRRDFANETPGIRRRETKETPRRFGRTAAALVLGALLVAGWFGAALLTGCGRTPPEPFWEATAEDSAAIFGWADQNKAMLSARFNESELVPCDTVMPGGTRKTMEDEIRDNPFKQRIRYNALQYVFDQEGYVFKPSFIATIDTVMKVAGGETTWVQETSATMTVAETIPGEFRIQAFSYTKHLRDTFIEPQPGETLVMHIYDSTFSPIDYVVAKAFEGTRTDGAVLKKVDGTWQPWKYAGGSWLNAPTSGEAPYVMLMDLMAGGQTVRLMLRPDTLQFGMQRFYTDDELPTFRRTDSLTIAQAGVYLFPAGFDAPMGAYIHFPDASGKYQRYEFFASPPRNPRVPLDVPPGVYTLYASQMPIQVLYEIEGNRLELDPARSGTYVGTVWGIRIRVMD